MNEHRLFQATEFALELIDEAEEIFTSIAGRLLFVAYHLEELGEEEAARRCRAAMDMDATTSAGFLSTPLSGLEKARSGRWYSPMGP